jgi:hypothetical protein
MGTMASGSNQKEVIKPVIRLFLIRHGETLANRRCIVVGQSHSVRTVKRKSFVRRTKRGQYCSNLCAVL